MSNPEPTSQQISSEVNEQETNQSVLTCQQSGSPIEEHMTTPQTDTSSAQSQLEERDNGTKKMKERRIPPPTSNKPVTRDPKGPATRKWIYGVGVSVEYLDAWASEINKGINTVDEKIDRSEFFSEIAEYFMQNGVPISVRTGYTGRKEPPPNDQYWETVNVLQMTDNEYGSRALEEVPQGWVEACRTFMKEEVTPKWYLKA